MFGPEFEEHFIRVKFGDEGGTSYRHHWEVENSKFLAKQVGTILNEATQLLGRLRRTRSELVWETSVESSTAQQGMGHACLKHPSVDLVPNEIEVINDVEAETQVLDGGLKPQKLVWTDGQGTISPDLADEIWVMHHKNRPKRVKDKAETEEVRPRAYQLIRVRPSMEKFDSGGPHPLRIEVSEAFNRPSPMYLNRSGFRMVLAEYLSLTTRNRPLIMILDTLGVKHSTFIKLQEEAMETAQAALDHPDSFATLMEMYELGKAFELPNLLRRLSRYNLQDLHNRDPFFRKLSCFSLYHAKRELKFHARIPVPGSWEVVGVADEHNQLGDGEIFGSSGFQTVHPGDVQLVTAVGKPEAASPYAIENLANTVIFSVKGKRPLAACLGGGDLDGDLYYLITNPELHPPKYEIPAWNDEYETHTLDRDSTITDIVDFVIEYMIHDTLGLIEVNHLRLADQRPEGVLDADCIRYAKLYSEATDYPETGKAITIDDMPKPKDIPDWDCPESSNPNNGDYYESTRALGALFRAVQLGDPEPGPLEDPVDREDFIRNALQEKVFDILNSHGVQPGDSEFFHRLFASFSCELKYQCAIHGIPQSVNSSLTEEEVVIGTILGKTTATNESQKRRDLMERLAKQSQDLVQQIKCEILGDRSALSPQEQLARAWTCLDVGWEITGANKFGRNSFFLVAFTSVLDLLHELDNAEHEESF
ncbi:hypothetical protein FRC00_009256 [Tulasnella sp. 408]|nr:hypothetical protein FRC00_009256 [Tulasnella sp. 408]